MKSNSVPYYHLKALGLFAALSLISAPLFSHVEAQTFSNNEQLIDIGGDGFSGGGDKTKPNCQISHPLSASTDFYIKWNCEDNTATRGELVTEVWILRPDAPRYVKVSDYLGFPASLLIDEALVGGPFSQWLPASFILIARDTAGNAAISAPFTITNRDNDVDTCTLLVSTRATESNGDTTGIPSLTTRLTDVPTFTQSTNDTTFAVSMFDPEVADPCEIDELCKDGGDDENEVFFSASITVDEEGQADGRINLSPGEFVINVEGTGTVSDSILDSVTLKGTTIIQDTVTDVVLNCSQDNVSTLPVDGDTADTLPVN